MSPQRVMVALLCFSCALSASNGAAQQTMFPEWMGREVEVLSGVRQGVIEDRQALFDAAPAQADATLDLAVLLCRVHVAEPERTRWDTFADPDLRVVLRAGSWQGAAWGSENSREVMLSFAGLTLVRGATLSFRVIDRDVTYDEAIETVRLRFTGALPIVGQGRHTDIECRAADASEMARRAEAARLEAEARLVDAASATPVLTRDDLGRPGLASARAAIVARMTYRGVRDREARAQRDRASAIEASFERALRSVVSEARAGLVPRGEWVSVPGGPRARVLETACGRRAIERGFPLLDARDARCAVRLELEAASEVDVDVLMASGELASAVMRPDPADARRIELGFATRIDARTAILRVGGAERALLALR